MSNIYLLNQKRARDNEEINITEQTDSNITKYKENTLMLNKYLNFINLYNSYLIKSSSNYLNEILIYLIISDENNFINYLDKLKKNFSHFFEEEKRKYIKISLIYNNKVIIDNIVNFHDVTSDKITKFDKIDISLLNQHQWVGINQILFLLCDNILFNYYVINNYSKTGTCTIIDYNDYKDDSFSILLNSIDVDKINFYYLSNQIKNETRESFIEKIKDVQLNEEEVDDFLNLFIEEEENEKKMILEEEEESEMVEEENEIEEENNEKEDNINNSESIQKNKEEDKDKEKGDANVVSSVNDKPNEIGGTDTHNQPNTDEQLDESNKNETTNIAQTEIKDELNDKEGDNKNSKPIDHQETKNNEQNEDIIDKEKGETESLIHQEKQKKNIDRKVRVILDFSTRNLIIDYPSNHYPYNTFYAYTYHGICHSFSIDNSTKDKLPDWNNLSLKHRTLHTSLKISNNIYISSDFNRYLLSVFDYKQNEKIIGSIPCEIYLSQYNLNHFTESQKDFYIAQYIANIFNIRLKLLDEKEMIKINNRDIYELNHYNSKFLVAQKKPIEQAEIPNAKLLESFSHFTYVISGGTFIISDLEKTGNLIYDLKLRKDRKNKMKFFFLHKCNDFCKKLTIDDCTNIKDSFFFDTVIENEDNIKICEICLCLFIPKENKFCEKCEKKIKENVQKILCQKCHELFDYSHYYYISMKEDLPSYCNKCQIK